MQKNGPQTGIAVIGRPVAKRVRRETLKGPVEIKRRMQHARDTGVRLSAVDHGTGPVSARPAGRVDRIFPRTNPTITLGSVAGGLGRGQSIASDINALSSMTRIIPTIRGRPEQCR